jgi:uncharacterized repeat protein (TIGR03803 family)
MGKLSWWRMGFVLSVFCTSVFCTMTVIAASAQTFKYENFNFAEGGKPTYGPLVQGANGDLYGTATVGGGPNDCPTSAGCGTVFEVSSAGKLTAIYSFCSQPHCPDGETPQAAVVLGADGNFYGTTSAGGISANCPFSVGCGTVFKITPAAQKGVFAICWGSIPPERCRPLFRRRGHRVRCRMVLETSRGRIWGRGTSLA